MEQSRVKVKAIIEVVGKPKEHTEKSIKLVIDKIRENEGTKVDQAKVFKPKPVENFFSTFAELDLIFDNSEGLLNFCFDFMPSSVEIIEPLELEMESVELANVLNDLLARLHGINANVTNITAENKLLKMNATGLLKNLFTVSLSGGPLALPELSSRVGIKEKEIKPFVDTLVKQGHIKITNDKYELALKK